MRIEPEKMLADLGAKVARLGLRQDQAEELMEHLQEGVTKLAGQVEDLGVAVQALAPAEDPEEGEGSDPCQVPNWRSLNAEQASEQWGILIDWCRDVLYPTYARPVWRPCWYRHWQVVEELSALCALWHWSYLKEAPPTRAGEWHARWWPHVQGVLKESFAQCGPSSAGKKVRHSTDHLPSPTLFADDEDLSKFIAAYLASREDSEGSAK